MLFVIFVVGLVVTFIFDRIIRKKYNIPFDFQPNRPINNTHKWFEVILLILLLIGIPITMFVFSHNELFALLLVFLTIYYSVRTILEYKYGVREEKQYFKNFIWAIGSFFTFIASILFIF